MLIVQNQMPLHAIVRSWTLLATLRAAHELLVQAIHAIVRSWTLLATLLAVYELLVQAIPIEQLVLLSLPTYVYVHVS